MRGVRIVATLGPATSTKELIGDLLQTGVHVVRLNFSHGSHQDHAHLYGTVREIANKLGRHVAILQDLPGPKIRIVGLEEGRPLELVPGHDVTLGEGSMVSTTYPHLHDVVAPGSRILLDDGRMELKVVAVTGKQVRCEVVWHWFFLKTGWACVARAVSRGFFGRC